MKKLAFLCAIFLTATLLSSCGGGSSATPSSVTVELLPIEGATSQSELVVVRATFAGGEVNTPTADNFSVLECTNNDCSTTTGANLCTVSFASLVATCAHDSFKMGTWYKITVSGVTDTSGLVVATATARFATIGLSNVTATLAPVNNLTNQSISVAVTASFAGGTVNAPTATNFSLLECTDSTCASTTVINLCTIFFASPSATCSHAVLKRSTWYQVAVTGVTDTSGLLVATATSKFQTMGIPPSDVTVTLSPSDGLTNQSGSVAVTAAFVGGHIATPTASNFSMLKCTDNTCASTTGINLCTVSYTYPTATCTYSGLLDPGVWYLVTVSGVTDTGGLIVATTTAKFQTGTSSGVTITLSPTEGATDQTETVAVTATFVGGAVNAPTASNFSLLECTDSGCTATAGSNLCTVSFVSPTATCAHDTLKISTWYKIAVADVTDTTGRIVATTTAKFQTSGYSTVTAALSPANGASNQSRGVNVTFTFSGAITAPTDLTLFTLKLDGTGSSLCTAVTADGSGLIYTCAHATLDASSSYTATVSGILDASGKLIATATATFSTGSSALVSVNSVTKDSVILTAGGNSVGITFGFDGVALAAPTLTKNGAPVTCTLAGDGRSCTATLTGIDGCATFTNYTLALSGAEYNSHTYVMNSADDEFEASPLDHIDCYSNNCNNDPVNCDYSAASSLLTMTVQQAASADQGNSCGCQKPNAINNGDMAITLRTTSNNPQEVTDPDQSIDSIATIELNGDYNVGQQNGWYNLDLGSGIIGRTWLIIDSRTGSTTGAGGTKSVDKDTPYVCVVKTAGVVTFYLSTDGIAFTKIAYADLDVGLGTLPDPLNFSVDWATTQAVFGIENGSTLDGPYSATYDYFRFRGGTLAGDATDCPKAY